MLLVVSIGPVPSQPRSTVTDRPSRVTMVPSTLAVWSDGEKAKPAAPKPRSLMKLPELVAPPASAWVRVGRQMRRIGLDGGYGGFRS